jgi:hypothetical protein
VVDELLERAQVDRVLVFLGDDQAEHVHVELAGGGQVGHDEFGVGDAEDVRRRRGRGRHRVGRRDGSFLRDEEAGGGGNAFGHVVALLR